MEIMPDINVWEHDAGSSDTSVRRQWRRNRQAAYRLGYKVEHGDQHPASKRKMEKSVETALLEVCDPPRGMGWDHFGILWDLHPEHPFTPVLRRAPVESEWDAYAADNAPELPVE